MRHKKISLIRLMRKPGNHPLPWRRGLQARLTVSYIGATLLSALFLQAAHTAFSFFIPRVHPTWSDTVGLLVASLIGGLIGIVSTRGVIRRLHTISAATTRFATGQYDQHLEVATADEIGQLETHFNQMAEQLASHLAREKILVEQNVRWEERARLSRDLHDSVKQHVFALAVQVELARSLFEQDRAAAWEHLGFADELSYQVQQELTGLIQALRPADLQTKDLIAALRDYVATWSRQNRIEAECSLPPTCLVPSPIEEALWRVMQEVLANVARHSQASHVWLCLERTTQQVTFSLSDNGEGFDPHAVEQKGLGLRSIRERIEQVGGTVLIQSAPGTGTHIVARCPLPGVSEHAPATNEVSA
jgi:two-component system, NarL family, sensor histidine kinase LiaS